MLTVFFLWTLVTSDAVLIDNVRQLAPSLDAATATEHVTAARRAASTAGLDAELLLAIAYVESRFEPTAISRVEGGRRRGGTWAHEHAAGKGPRFCGVMQTGTQHDWKACVALRDLDASYAAGARMLRDWLKMSGGDMAAALNGYACGMYGLKNGCKRYADRVRGVQRRLTRTTS